MTVREQFLREFKDAADMGWNRGSKFDPELHSNPEIVLDGHRRAVRKGEGSSDYETVWAAFYSRGFLAGFKDKQDKEEVSDGKS